MLSKRIKKLGFILASFILFIALILTGSYYLISSTANDLYDDKVHYLTEISDKNALLIETKITDLLSALEAIPTFIKNPTTLSLKSTLDLLNEENSRNEFKRMGIAFSDGQAYTTDKRTIDISDREYFKIALSGVTNVSNRLTDFTDDEPINVFATPIYEKDNVVGVLFATINISAFTDILVVNSFHNEGYSYIIEQDGSPVIHTNHVNSLSQYENLFDELANSDTDPKDILQFKEDVSMGKNGLISLYSNGIKKHASYTRIPINDWYMISVVPSNVISHISDNLIRRITGATVFVLFLTFSFCLFLVSYFRRTAIKMQRLAFNDEVTGFYNWNKFSSLSYSLLTGKTDIQYALVALDIDKFKMINDIYNYETGNTVLQHVAATINSIMKDHDCFARVSSDHFSMLISYTKVDQIIESIQYIDGHVKDFLPDYIIQVYFGVYLIDDTSLSISVINDRASLAINNIKNKLNRSSNYSFFNEHLRNVMISEKELENATQAAFNNEDFYVYLQPKYSLVTEKIVGAEALVRWNYLGKGILYPNNFIPLFEKNGSIRKLDIYMFNKVCQLIAKWDYSQNITFCPISISVNLSRVHLTNTALPHTLLSIANKYGVHPNHIEIEITETAIMNDTVNQLAIMKEFKALGFKISIDDFGSGYSSLHTLKDIPADTLKLDRGFLKDSTNDIRGKQIISSLIDMTKALSLSSVAEGVETQNQVDFLKDIHCDIAQGYYYAKPMPVPEFEDLVISQFNTISSQTL